MRNDLLRRHIQSFAPIIRSRRIRIFRDHVTQTLQRRDLDVTHVTHDFVQDGDWVCKALFDLQYICRYKFRS